MYSHQIDFFNRRAAGIMFAKWHQKFGFVLRQQFEIELCANALLLRGEKTVVKPGLPVCI